MGKTVGVLGGGQLCLMLKEVADRLNIPLHFLDSDGAPASRISEPNAQVVGSFKDEAKIRELAHGSDIVTIEIEHVDVDALDDLRTMDEECPELHPDPQTIKVVQDKYHQKVHYEKRGIHTPRFLAVPDESSVRHVTDLAEDLGGFPVMLKSRTNAYDGRGNFPLRTVADVDEGLRTLAGRPLYMEQWSNFKMELAVMVVKTKSRSTADWESATLAFSTVETVHEDSICKLVYAPARGIAAHVAAAAEDLARKAVATFWGKGVFGVEMFLLEDGESLQINEIAPRVHNSGHYTIEACRISQFEAHLRAILDLPLSAAHLALKSPAVMLNVLGGGTAGRHAEIPTYALSVPEATTHMYWKEGKPGRKVGHVTVTAGTIEEAVEKIQPLVDIADKIRAERVGTASSTTSNAPSTKTNHLRANAEPEARSDTSSIRGPRVGTIVAAQAKSVSETGLSTARGKGVTKRPLVGVTMGSDSDLKVMMPAFEILEKLGIPYETRVTSAHRTPDEMFEYGAGLKQRGIKVAIAAAGGAAHLPGMLATKTPLPVIGVPVEGSTMGGNDSLLSIVQMPKGCPVATVGINNSTNAALTAARIVALLDPQIEAELDKFISQQAETVRAKDMEMQETGPHTYYQKYFSGT